MKYINEKRFTIIIKYNSLILILYIKINNIIYISNNNNNHKSIDRNIV